MSLTTTPQMEDKNDEEMQVIISSLPQEKVWFLQPLYKYENFWFYKHELESILIREKSSFIPNTVVLSTYPKCGTTWFAALIFTMVNRSRYNYSDHPLLTNSPHDCVQWLVKPHHVNINYDVPNIVSNFPVFKTHWAYSLLPQSIKRLKCPIIYVCRDPVDKFVSLWHFINNLRPKEEPHLGLNEAFDLYCKGVAPYGSYWDHVLQYWRASLEMPNTVMFVRYEDMNMQPVKVMKMIATFLGCDFSSEEEQNGVIEGIIEFCSFDKLTSFDVNQRGEKRSFHGKQRVEKRTDETDKVNFNNNVFFRKGVIGDHKNYLTNDMISRLRDITDMKFQGSGLDGKIYANSPSLLDKPS